MGIPTPPRPIFVTILDDSEKSVLLYGDRTTIEHNKIAIKNYTQDFRRLDTVSAGIHD
ncbi:MAG: hypothetical protein ACK559_35765 [bacterium]